LKIRVHWIVSSVKDVKFDRDDLELSVGYAIDTLTNLLTPLPLRENRFKQEIECVEFLDERERVTHEIDFLTGEVTTYAQPTTKGENCAKSRRTRRRKV